MNTNSHILYLYLNSDLSLESIASKFNISTSQVLSIINTKQYKSLSKSSFKRKTILSPKQKSIIKNMKAQLYPNNIIAKTLGIPSRTFDRIAIKEKDLFYFPLPSNSKLAGKVDSILSSYNKYLSYSKVAAYFHVSPTTIKKIINHFK